MTYKIEARIVDISSGKTVAGLASQALANLDSAETQLICSRVIHAVLATAVASSPISGNVIDQTMDRGDKDGSFQLRRFAELLDNGKYVLNVVTRSLSDDTTEIRLLLDKRKS